MRPVFETYNMCVMHYGTHTAQVPRADIADLSRHCFEKPKYEFVSCENHDYGMRNMYYSLQFEYSSLYHDLNKEVFVLFVKTNILVASGSIRILYVPNYARTVIVSEDAYIREYYSHDTRPDQSSHTTPFLY